jgi:hypothetical protein
LKMFFNIIKYPDWLSLIYSIGLATNYFGTDLMKSHEKLIYTTLRHFSIGNNTK